jgi:hypothetical protein
MWEAEGISGNTKMSLAFNAMGDVPKKPLLRAPSGIRGLFTVLDTDGDGDIDVPELQAFVAREDEVDQEQGVYSNPTRYVDSCVSLACLLACLLATRLGHIFNNCVARSCS